MKNSILIFLIVLIAACSPEKRLQRLLDHHPELRHDTLVTFTDTVQVPGFRIDTLIKYSGRNDTITVIKNNVITKLVIHKDSVFIRTIQKPTDIIKTVTVPITQVIYAKTKNNWIMFWIGFSISLLLICLAGILLRYLNK